ncbi:MAG: esterase-like activity of phytase family protein [Bacteroidota bacterium]
MMSLKTLSVFFVLLMTVSACDKDDSLIVSDITSIRYIGEQVLGSLADVDGTTLGGLSSIDYDNGTFFAISDDANAPIRYYQLNLTYSETSFTAANVTGVTRIKDASGNDFADGMVDPEGLRFEPTSGNFIWISEGQINQGINPSIREITSTGAQVRTIPTPTIFNIDPNDPAVGPRQNGTFEGLSKSVDEEAIWVAMELPLLQDGQVPSPLLSNTDQPVRISRINTTTGVVEFQFAYFLGPLARDSNPPGGFAINGVVEILEYNTNQFLVIERSFAAGYADGGNDVKIFKVDARQATNVQSLNALGGATYTVATKSLLFDFESIRAQLTGGIVDNIEGITFGPELPNGSASLVVIADDNFSAFGPQLNQIIAFEVNP